jgi:hypothetical protein
MKTIYIIYCALIALAAFSAPVSAETVGDANNDNRITTADAAVALRMSVGSVAPDIERADVSGDGRVSSLDALMLLSMARKTQVGVTAPEVVTGTFDATIEICNVADLDSGQFDISFDASVVNVIGVDSGSVGATEVPLANWTFRDSDTVRVLFNLPGVTGVSGSGTLATIHFEVLGVPEDASIDISDGLLFDTASDEVSALWFDDLVTVKPSVTVNASEAVSDTFDATIEICNVADLDSGQFDISFDANVVNVIGVDPGSIGATEVGWAFRDSDTVRVIFNLPGVTGVSGSGTLATIHFEVLGVPEDASILDISNGLLFDTASDEVSALWFDDLVTVGVLVTVNASESISGTFNATIDIADVTDLDSGQFELSFNASVVNVTGVSPGSVCATTVPWEGWTFIDSDTVIVIFNLPGTTGVSGSGTLATIHFEVTGTSGDTSTLAISDGLLVDTGAGRILSVWIDDEVSV